MTIFINGQSNRIPAANSPDNKIFSDVIGTKLDTHNGDSIAAFGYTILKHVHSPSDVYPSLADDVQVIAAAGVWALGSFKEIVPVNGITNDFDIHFIEISTASANDVFQIHLYAVEVLIAKARFARTTNQVRVASKPFQTVIIPANTQIQAKLSSKAGGSKTADISIQFHPY